MSEIKIKQCDSLAKSGKTLFVMKAYLALIHAGFADANDYMVRYDDSIVYAEIDGKIVGCMTYKEQTWNNKLTINISFIDEVHRRKGIYGMLYEKLKSMAVEKGIVEIISGVHVNNTGMRACAESCGRKAMAIIYSEDIRAELLEEK